jgi:hypothetical protein
MENTWAKHGGASIATVDYRRGTRFRSIPMHHAASCATPLDRLIECAWANLPTENTGYGGLLGQGNLWFCQICQETVWTASMIVK